MGLENIATEEVAFGLFPLDKNPAFGGSAALDAHPHNQKIGSGLHQNTVRTWKEARAVQNRQWRDVYKAGPVANMNEDVTQRGTKVRVCKSESERDISLNQVC